MTIVNILKFLDGTMNDIAQNNPWRHLLAFRVNEEKYHFPLNIFPI